MQPKIERTGKGEWEREGAMLVEGRGENAHKRVFCNNTKSLRNKNDINFVNESYLFTQDKTIVTTYTITAREPSIHPNSRVQHYTNNEGVYPLGEVRNPCKKLAETVGYFPYFYAYAALQLTHTCLPCNLEPLSAIIGYFECGSKY